MVDIDESVKDYIVAKDDEKSYGARPLRRAIQTVIEDNITDAIIDGTLKTNVRKTMIIENGEVLFK